MNSEILQIIYHIFGVIFAVFGLSLFLFIRLKKIHRKFLHEFGDMLGKMEKSCANKLDCVEKRAANRLNLLENVIQEKIKQEIQNSEIRIENRINQMEIRLSSQMNGRFMKMEERERDLEERTLFLEFKKDPPTDHEVRRRGRPRKH